MAFQREQRDRISRKLEAMTPEERVVWMKNLEPTDPILRRVMERARRSPTGAESAPDLGSDEVDASPRHRLREPDEP